VRGFFQRKSDLPKKRAEFEVAGGSATRLYSGKPERLTKRKLAGT